MASRYLVGIDLGTSNSALAYFDSLAPNDSPSQVMEITQAGPGGALEKRELLPSFTYLATEDNAATEASREAVGLPPEGQFYSVGLFARAQTARQPDRVIASAKSWLSHGGVDREAAILPWGSAAVTEKEKLSPVEASAYYLRHLRAVWNRTIGRFEPEYRLENQEVVLTIPASFDEAARQLTLQAAKAAGLPEVKLLEEPQAAFYRWLESHSLEESLFAHRPELSERGAIVLVCDVGGGTSDFSLFEVHRSSSGEAEIKRISVSDHILLGGDNIDLALAREFEQRLLGADAETERLSARQWTQLVFSSRAIKEQALSDAEADPDALFHVSLPAEGGSLFANTLSAAISRGEVVQMVSEGFFPETDQDSVPLETLSGLAEWGLPFASDSAVTRHLAGFLKGRPVDAILFNGGTPAPEFLRKRIQRIVGKWQVEEPLILRSEHMELAVARGAAYYARLRRENRGQISGGYPRSLYVELHKENSEGGVPLVCVLPQGFPEGERLELRQPEFKVLVGRPVRFQLFYSTQRPNDIAGQVVTANARDFHPLPPMQTHLAAEIAGKGGRANEKLLEVHIETRVSEVGVLSMELVEVNGTERLQLDFNLRRPSGAAEAEEQGAEEGPGVSPSALVAAEGRIRALFGKAKQANVKVSAKKLVTELEAEFNQPREDWNLALLRSLWPPLEKGITRRGRSQAHEAAWLNLAGFALRPGYGEALDSFRIDQLWRCFELGLAFPKERSSQVQWWIMWRRVAGGLSQERQQLLYRAAMKALGRKGEDYPEVYRLLGSLERIDSEAKRTIGKQLIARITGRKTTGIEQYIWTLGRLGSRVPLYASAHLVVPVEDVSNWFRNLRDLDWRRGDYRHLNAACAQWMRRTGDRARDVSEEVRREALSKMEQSGATDEQLRVVREFVEVDFADQVMLFGEQLPAGLRLADS